VLFYLFNNSLIILVRVLVYFHLVNFRIRKKIVDPLVREREKAQ
jgi:hypothetical protein